MDASILVSIGGTAAIVLGLIELLKRTPLPTPREAIPWFALGIGVVVFVLDALTLHAGVRELWLAALEGAAVALGSMGLYSGAKAVTGR